jgi:hypothetical protein
MVLNSVDTVLLPRTRAELPTWLPGMAVLGGGTWLFSERQPDIRTLVDLTALRWEHLMVDAEGLHIAGTCPIAALSRLASPPDWRAGDLIGRCCEALPGSFKVWNAATVGGNICLALPAGPMIALAAALGGIGRRHRPGQQPHDAYLPYSELRRCAGDRGAVRRHLGSAGTARGQVDERGAL